MRSTIVCVVLLMATAASAQTTVSASLTGDITRFSRVEVNPDLFGFGLGSDLPPDGEALGFTAGVARAIGERWGVAFEFGQTGEIESRTSQGFAGRLTILPTLPRVLPPDIVVPDVSFETTTTLELTTMNALVWVKHSAGDRIELSYTGGLAFVRSESEQSFTISDPRMLAIWALPANTEYVEHRAAPVVGMDVSFSLTDHAAVIGGVRATAVEVLGTPGWLVRPGIGVRWRF